MRGCLVTSRTCLTGQRREVFPRPAEMSSADVVQNGLGPGEGHWLAGEACLHVAVMNSPYQEERAAQAQSTAPLFRTWLSSSGCINPRRIILSSESLWLKSKAGLSLRVKYCGLLLGFGEWWVMSGFFHSLSLSRLSRAPKQQLNHGVVVV